MCRIQHVKMILHSRKAVNSPCKYEFKNVIHNYCALINTGKIWSLVLVKVVGVTHVMTYKTFICFTFTMPSIIYHINPKGNGNASVKGLNYEMTLKLLWEVLVS